MLYQGIIGGGSSPVEPEDLSPVLLWENPSPSNAFNNQVVSLDLTEYAGVIVDFNEGTSGISMTRVFCKKSESSYFGAGGAPSGEGFGRSFNITNEGVVFGPAYALNVVNNNYVVPSKIYGVKEYVVEPVIGDLLWTNPNPTAALSTTEINGDYSKYKSIRVKAKVTSADTFASEFYIAKSTSANAAGISFTALGTADYYRNIIFTDSKITIDSGHKATGGAVTLVDTAAIPLEIYGIE